MQLLEGKPLADELKQQLKEIVEDGKDRGETFRLCIIQVGNNPASATYVKNKIFACEYIGINAKLVQVDENCTQDELIDVINMYNCDDNVNGIIVQLPLPKHINEDDIAAAKRQMSRYMVRNAGRMICEEAKQEIHPSIIQGGMIIGN